MTERPIDVVHVGSASRDATEDDPRGWRLGGGASYAALATARLGLRTAAVIGVDEAAATATELDLLREAGVDLLLIALDEGPVFRNREAPGGRVQDCLATGRPMRVPDVPLSWQAAQAWSLVPVAGELDDRWAAAVPDGAIVSVGWQGLLRDMVAGREVARRAPARSQLLARADLVGVSRHDLEPGTAVTGLLRLLRPGADLIVTDGAAGGMLARLGRGGRLRSRTYAATPPIREVDPTGAGDVLLAALLASRVLRDATGRTPRSGSGLDMEFAAGAASFVLEAPGLYGIPDRQSVLARLGRHQRSGPRFG